MAAKNGSQMAFSFLPLPPCTVERIMNVINTVWNAWSMDSDRVESGRVPIQESWHKRTLMTREILVALTLTVTSSFVLP